MQRAVGPMWHGTECALTRLQYIGLAQPFSDDNAVASSFYLTTNPPLSGLVAEICADSKFESMLLPVAMVLLPLFIDAADLSQRLVDEACWQGRFRLSLSGARYGSSCVRLRHLIPI